MAMKKTLPFNVGDKNSTPLSCPSSKGRVDVFIIALFLLQNQFSSQVEYIFTLGDIAQLCPARVEKRAFLLIQSIVASSADADHCKALELIPWGCCLKPGWPLDCCQ